jgi:class 3 adenylate cyclase/tetratricopeptide (TPR) repeat protein
LLVELDADLLETYFSRRHLAHLAAGPGAAVPGRRDGSAAVLFVDVAGCTALSEELARRGAVGAEELSAIFDRLFGRITSIVTDLGGDVLTYAGDAVWAMWPTDGPGGECPLGQAVCLAAQAALGVQAELAGQLENDGAGPGSGKLRVRASVGAGAVSSLDFAALDARSDLVVAGEAMRDAAEVDQQARPGDVVLSSRAWRVAQDSCRGTPLEGGAARLSAVLRRPVAPAPAVAAQTAPLPRLVRSLLPSLVERLSAGMAGWLAEFRALTVLFVNLAGFDIQAVDERWQRAVLDLRATAAELDGDLYQMLVDEKGFTVVLAFGLPGRSHEDDAARGVRAALAVQRKLEASNLRASIGVTSGPAFCGLRGSERRRQYTIVGPMMNLAARLMQASAGGVLCDLPTVEAANAVPGIGFERQAPLAVKGRSEPLANYRPIAAALAPTAPPRSSSQRLVGRSAEASALREAVGALRAGGPSAVVLLEGDAGIGKSRLVGELAGWLRAEGVRHFVGAGVEIEAAAPYYAFRAVFHHLFALDGIPDDAEASRSHCLARLAAQPELQRLAPLLGVVLPLGWKDNEATAVLSGQGRAEIARDLLLGCLQDRERPVPTVLVIEDAHWLDSASWGLLLNAARRLPGLLVVLTTRPLETPPAAYRELGALAGARTLRLASMDSDHLVEVVRQKLDVGVVPVPVAALVCGRAGGNPFFASELACALRDFGLLDVSGDRCALAPGIVDPAKRFEELLAERGLPVSLQGVTTSRMDRLSQEEQLVLKVASVLGHRFTLSTLEAVFPLAESRPRLPAILANLGRLDILRAHTREAETTFILRHAITQEAAYAKIPFAQRRQLHRALAEHHEKQEVAAHLWPVLAHHWRRAEEPHKALDYLVRAGDDALGNYANEEAVSFFSDALELDQVRPQSKQQTGLARERRGRWALDLGRAYTNWCKYPEAREHLESGLRLLGHAIPGRALGVAWALTKAVLRQFGVRLWGQRLVGREADRKERLLLAARAYEGLAETYFNTGASLPCVYAALASLNLAERAGPSAELARGYASIGAILGFIPAPGLARAYCERALAVAGKTADPAAQAWVAVAAGVFEAGLGRWEPARSHFEQTRSIAATLGDRRRIDDAAQNLAAVHWFQGNLAGSLRLGDQLYASAQLRSDLYMQAEGLRRRAYCLLLMGHFTEAAGAIDSLHDLRRGDRERPLAQRHSDVHALRALLHLRRAQFSEACDQADEAARIQAAAPPMFYDVLLEYAAAAEVYLTLREQGRLRSARPGRRACKRLKALARIFPIARPAALLWAGLCARLDGHEARARLQWRQALEAASAQGMPHFQALALLAMGRHLPHGSHERVEHLTQAERLLREVGDRYHLEQTHLWLGSTASTLRRTA